MLQETHSLSESSSSPRQSDSTPEKHAVSLGRSYSNQWSLEAPKRPRGQSRSYHYSPSGNSGNSDRQLGPWNKGKWGKRRGGSRLGVDQSRGHRRYGDKSREDKQGKEGKSRCTVAQGGWDKMGR